MYAAQTGVCPPNFALFTNVGTSFHFSYQRFLVNQLRSEYGFVGTPIRLQVRARRARRGAPEDGATPAPRGRRRQTR
jgi:GTP-binding protein